MDDENVRAHRRATLLAERQAAELRRRARGTQLRRLPLPRNGFGPPVTATPTTAPSSPTRPDGGAPTLG